MKDTNRIGSLTEAKVLAALMMTGLSVSVPFGVAKYDLILDTGTTLNRVQCKTGRLRDGIIAFRASSVARDGSRVAYKGTADLFGVYCPENDKVYIVPVDHHVAMIHLRVDPVRNGQAAGINLAADYEVEKFLANVA